MGSLLRRISAVVLVIGVTLVVHWPVLETRALSFDDAEYVAHNNLVLKPGWSSAARFFAEVEKPSTFTGYYHPLSMTLLMVGAAAGGRAEHPRPFHVISLALHTINAVLVLLLLVSLFGEWLPAVPVAVLFAIHPLTVEPVAWIGEQKALLAAAFSLGSLLFYVDHARTGTARSAVFTGFFFFLALLSKPTAISLPLLFVVLDYWPLRRPLREGLRVKWPFFALAAAFAFVTLLSQQGVGGIAPTSSEETARWPLRVVYVIALDLGKIVWPHRLSSAYPQPEPLALTNPVLILSAIVVAVVSILCVWASRRGRGPLAAWAFFLIALAPTLAPVKYTWALGFDNYLYLPMLGWGLLLASALSALRVRRPTGVIFPALLVGLGGAAIAEAQGVRATLVSWGDSLRLYSHMEAISPRSPAVQNQLGLVYARRGETDEAIRHLRRAVELEPGYGGAHYNLGVELAARGDLSGSIAAFETSTRLMPADADAHFNLGVALRQADRFDDAEGSFRRAVNLRPDHVEAAVALGQLLARRGMFGEVATLYRRAVLLRPNDARLHYALAAALTSGGAPEESVAVCLERASALQPAWPPPLNDLAWMRSVNPGSALFDPGQAVRLAERALASGGDDPRLLDTYSVTLAAAGQFAKAESVEARAVRIAEAGNARALASELRGRLSLYSHATPYRESAGSSR